MGRKETPQTTSLPLMGEKESEKKGKYQGFKFYYVFHLKTENQTIAGLITPSFYAGNPICLSAPFSGTWMFQHQVPWTCLLALPILGKDQPQKTQ